MAFTPVVVPLTQPVTHNKTTYTELTFARLMVGRDMVNMDAVQGGMRKTYALYASLADVPLPVILEMLTADLELVAQAVAGLTGKSSVTAAVESPATE